MNSVNVSAARSKFQELLNRVCFGRERIVVERRGKPIAAIVSIEDLKRLEAIEDVLESTQLRRAIEENDSFVTLESIVAQRGE